MRRGLKDGGGHNPCGNRVSPWCGRWVWFAKEKTKPSRSRKRRRMKPAECDRQSEICTPSSMPWQTMRQLVRRSRRAGWLIERALRRCPGQARRRACCVPLAVACGAAPLQPRKRRAQHQHAAHQAAECCTGVQRTLRRCGVASPPCPRSRRAAARPSTSCRSCALPKGSTGCSRSLRSFVQRSARATPHTADPQSGQEAVCGRPGSAYSPPPRPCPPPGRARSGDTTISGIVCPRTCFFFESALLIIQTDGWTLFFLF